MAIEQIKVRARVVIGTLTVATPYVQSFNVRKQRGQVSTFDASLKVSQNQVAGTITGDNVKIYAGTVGSQPLIFSGLVRSAKISPCYDDPKYVLLSVSGADILSTLAGKKYTRRCRATKAAWVAITSLSRPGLKSGKFSYQNEPALTMDPGELNRDSALTTYVAQNAAGINSAAPPKSKAPAAPSLAQEIITPGQA